MALPTKKIPELTAYGLPLGGTEMLEIWAVNTSRRITARDFVLPNVDALITAVDMTSVLPASRYLTAGAGVVFVDGGPGQPFQIGASGTGAVAGNPTGLIGLTPVNGVALTWTRSDATHAIDQGIAPSWTAQHIFASPGGATNNAVSLSSILPILNFNETDAAADNRRWRTYVSSEVLSFDACTDDGLTGGVWLAVNRTGTTIDSVALTSTALTWNGSPLISVASGFPDGLVGTPSIFFTSDPNTGLYRVSADVLGITTGGVQRARFEPTFTRIIQPILGDDGTVGAPFYSFINDPDTGMYGNAGNQIRFTAGGVLGFIVDGGHVYLQDGLVGTPGIAFASDTDTGIYRAGANQLTFAAGGASIMNVTTTTVNFNQHIDMIDGTVGAPGYSFGNDTNTGIYRSAADTMNVAAGGVDVALFRGDGLILAANMVMFARDGTAAAPGYSFASEADVGIYRLAADQLGFAVGGIRHFSIASNIYTFGSAVAATNLSLRLNGVVSKATAIAFQQSDTNQWLLGDGAASEDNTFELFNAVAGVLCFKFSDTTGAMLFPDGSAANPPISFQSDPDTGIYRSGANRMAFSAGGSVGLIVSAGALETGANGTAAAPAIVLNDANTGIYTVGVDTGGLCAGGVVSAAWDNSTTGGDTRFFVSNEAGTVKRVLYGAADSGGAGFRMLRFAN